MKSYICDFVFCSNDYFMCIKQKIGIFEVERFRISEYSCKKIAKFHVITDARHG